MVKQIAAIVSLLALMLLSFPSSPAEVVEDEKPTLFGSEYTQSAEALLSSADPFYDQQYENAVPIGDSRFFEIGYRVCKLPEERQTTEGVRSIQYDLILTNKTDAVLKDVSFTAHFKDSLQMVLAAPSWYNEPMDLGAAHQEGAVSTVIYTWNPFVVLRDVGRLKDIKLTDFYDLLIEIQWSTGREVIRFDADSVNIPEYASKSLAEEAPLDEMELSSMIEQGRQILGE